MKIAFLNAYQDRVNRGAETFVFEVSQRLRKKHEVTIVSGNMAPKQRWPILWRLFVDPQGISILFFTLNSLQRIWKEKPDIVIPVNGGWQPAVLRLITWLYGGKMVISGQSGKGWDDRNNLWCFPDAFISLSSFLTGWAKKVNPFVKVEYISNGVDLDKFEPQGEKRNFALIHPIILCVGALTNEKRIDLVIRAVARLKKASLVVVGEGPLREDLVNLGKELLGKRFLLTKEEFLRMPEIYRGADLFTIPSPWYRSFEIVLVEAMASNLSVVANNDPIRAEIVGDAGILVDPTKIGEYTMALEKALKTEWGEKPRRQAEKFDWDIIAKKYEDLFKKLLA